jgi:DNA polymerase III epsilon subunit-like protein
VTKIYSALPHLNGNVMAAIDVETTGTRPGYHEIIQIAVQPLDSDFRPLKGVRPFYHNMAPLYPEREDKRATAVHKLDVMDLAATALSPDKVADRLREYIEALDLPFERVLVPLAHNWAFEAGHLRAWLGMEEVDKLFHSHARDAMLFALALNDRSAFIGQPAPFSHVSLTHLAKQFGVVNLKPHDALCDSLAEAEVYRSLVLFDF